MLRIALFCVLNQHLLASSVFKYLGRLVLKISFSAPSGNRPPGLQGPRGPPLGTFLCMCGMCAGMCANNLFRKEFQFILTCLSISSISFVAGLWGKMHWHPEIVYATIACNWQLVSFSPNVTCHLIFMRKWPTRYCSSIIGKGKGKGGGRREEGKF